MFMTEQNSTDILRLNSQQLCYNLYNTYQHIFTAYHRTPRSKQAAIPGDKKQNNATLSMPTLLCCHITYCFVIGF
jgi:deferrochelatase/peroxidase EfeB